MIIFYEEPRSRSEFVAEIDEKGAFVKDQNGQNRLKEINFKPGINDIPKKDWELLLKQSEIVAKHFEDGIFKIIPGEGLSEMSVEEAKKIIRETFDIVLLNSWKSKEKRGTLLDVIAEQISSLELKDEREKK